MSTTLIVIASHVLSVFASRFLNKLCYKKDNNYPITPLVWFIPLVGVLVWTFFYITEWATERSNWFNGKNW
jgi:lipid-A-disaccharide synthase-like uncharacterized protein